MDSVTTATAQELCDAAVSIQKTPRYGLLREGVQQLGVLGPSLCGRSGSQRRAVGPPSPSLRRRRR
jgi:hypothetical protein